ncbi:hypothetical protein [Nocardia sp. SSK8]|uniref:hypothetical protein n=1 Tax=Nocardia sp. SSK8 TaxID=3120154 RepID=UPI00300BB359
MGHSEHEPGATIIEFPAQGAAASLRRGADGVLRYGDLHPALTELLDLRVHAFTGREAVVEVGGPRLTYRELWYSAARIAGGLQAHGIGSTATGSRCTCRPVPAGCRPSSARCSPARCRCWCPTPCPRRSRGG